MRRLSILQRSCLILLSLVLFLPLSVFSADKTLVILPFVIYADQPGAYLRQGIESMFHSRLSGGGLAVIGQERYVSLLSEKERQGIASEKRAEDLARGLEADYAVFGSITAIGSGYSLDVSLLELKKGESKLTRVSEAVNEEEFIPRLADVAYQIRAIIEGVDIPTRRMARPRDVLPEEETAKGLFHRPASQAVRFDPTGRLNFNMDAMSLDVGDLDGDGEPELIVLAREKLLLHKRDGDSFVLKDTLKRSHGEDFFKVSVGDMDKNGRDEIYLVSNYGLRARSTVLEWSGGGLKRIYRKIGHIRVLRDADGDQPMLLFQDSKIDEFFSGKIWVMGDGKGQKPIQKEPLIEFEDVRFYTLTMWILTETETRNSSDWE